MSINNVISAVVFSINLPYGDEVCYFSDYLF